MIAEMRIVDKGEGKIASMKLTDFYEAREWEREKRAKKPAEESEAAKVEASGAAS